MVQEIYRHRTEAPLLPALWQARLFQVGFLWFVDPSFSSSKIAQHTGFGLALHDLMTKCFSESFQPPPPPPPPVSLLPPPLPSPSTSLPPPNKSRSEKKKCSPIRRSKSARIHASSREHRALLRHSKDCAMRIRVGPYAGRTCTLRRSLLKECEVEIYTSNRKTKLIRVPHGDLIVLKSQPTH